MPIRNMLVWRGEKDMLLDWKGRVLVNKELGEKGWCIGDGDF